MISHSLSFCLRCITTFFSFLIPPADLLTPALTASIFRIMRGLGMRRATGLVLCISSVYIKKSLHICDLLATVLANVCQLRTLMMLGTSNRQFFLHSHPPHVSSPYENTRPQRWFCMSIKSQTMQVMFRFLDHS